MSNFDSKSLLAKLMATENLFVEQANVRTASFDVLNRVLTIPKLDEKLSSDLYDLFIGHEVGHALYTPLEEMQTAKNDGVHMSIVNVVEDYRIERKIKNKYPGLKNCFVKAYVELNERDFFEIQGKDLQEYNFIDRMNLLHKIGPILGIKFTDFEKSLIKEVESCEKYDEVIEVSKKIYDYMKDELEKEEKTKIKIGIITDDGDQDGLSMDGSNENSPEEFDIIIDARNNNEEGSPGEQNDNKQDADDSNSENKNNSKKDIDEKLKSKTDEAYKKNEEQLFSKSNKDIVYVCVPKFDTKKIYDYKNLYKDFIEDSQYFNLKESLKYFMKFKKESNKVVSFLVKEFELKKNAEQLKKTSISKTGELNMNKIFSYKFNEDIFKKITVMPDGKSHGLIMFLDWSGSMTNHIGNTVKQLLNLALFCRKVNIPFEVYSFNEETKEEYMCEFNFKHRDLGCNRFGLLNILSSRMNNKDFTTAGTVLMEISGLGDRKVSTSWILPIWMRMSGTPLNEAIIAAMEIVPEFQKKNHLQIINTVFLTDGESNQIHDIHFGKDGQKHTIPIRNSYGAPTVVIRDRKTRFEEKYDWAGWSRMEQTDALIRLLKHRTNSHVIGFYVTHTSEYKNKIRYFHDVETNERVDYGKIDVLKKEFVKNKYAISTKTGFDDYYILRSNGLDLEDDAEFEVRENATTRGIVSAFTKYAGNRINNRVILNRFISWIS